MPLLLLAAAIVLGTLAAHAAPLPDPAMPEVLLAAPINATWAANTARRWRDRGFSGFFFQGIADTLPALHDGQSVRAGIARLEDPALRKEIAGAQRRLSEAGLAASFLHLALAPEERWFADADALRVAEDFFESAGAFCAAAALRGMVIDANGESPLFDYRWDGYADDSGEAARLEEGARAFGRRAVRAFVRSQPGADILVRIDDLARAGPLWFPFAAGCLEAPGAADTVRVFIAFRESGAPAAPGETLARAAALRRGLGERLPPELQPLWEDAGRIVMGAAPLGYEGEAPVAYCTPEAFRVQLAAAMLASDGYAIVDAPQGGWWALAADEARQYRKLRQTGKAAAAAVRPLHPAWNNYSARTPLRGLARIGPSNVAGAPVYVLEDGDAGAALFWQGLPEPMPLDNRFASAKTVDLESGERREHFPADGALYIPATDRPLLVEGLPVAEWSLPAALRVLADAAPAAGRASLPIRFGLYNPTGARLEGELELIASEGFGTGRGRIPAAADPGQTVLFERALQGVFEMGADPTLQLALHLPGLPPIGRTVQLVVTPPQRWAAPLDGRPAGGPVLVSDPSLGTLAVVASAGGDVAAFDLGGTRRWCARVRDRLGLGPVAWRVEPAGRAFAVSGDRGLLYIVDAAGRVRAQWPTPPEQRPVQMLEADLFGAAYAGLVVAGEGGRMACLLPDGAVLWETRYGPSVRAAVLDRVTVGPAALAQAHELGIANALFAAVSGGPMPALYRLSAMGQRVWMQPLEADAASPPLVFPMDTDHPFAVALPLADGGVLVWDAATGMPIAGYAFDQPLAQLAMAEAAPRPGLELLALGATGLEVLTRGFAPVWRLPVAGLGGAAACKTEGDAGLVVTGDPVGLWRVDAQGRMRWSDPRPFGAPIGAPLAGDLDGDGMAEAIYAGADRMVRCIELGPVRARPAAPGAAEPAWASWRKDDE